VPQLYIFDKVAGGRRFSVGLRQNGAIAIWGDFSYGTFPGTDFVDVCAGTEFIIALRSNGTIVVKGYDYAGVVSNAPTGDGFTAIAAGAYHAVALHEEPSGVEDGSSSTVPELFVLQNPCMGTPSFAFTASTSSRVLEVFDVAGRMVDSVEVPAGAESIQWIHGAPNGLYVAVMDEASVLVTVVR
jgi:hypothetical protein